MKTARNKAASLLLGLGVLASCGGGVSSVAPSSSASSSESISSEEIKQDIKVESAIELGSKIQITDKGSIGNLFKEEYADPSNDVDAQSIVGANLFQNGVYRAKDVALKNQDDVKLEFYTESHVRYADLSSGYAITLPLSSKFSADFTLARNSMRFVSKNEIVKTSYEEVRPYAKTAQGYNTYMNEWFATYISKQAYIDENDFEYFLPTESKKKTVLSGFEVTSYHILIHNAGSIAYPYYNIAVIKKNGSYAGFFFVMVKSKTADQSIFDSVVASYTKLDKQGEAKNYLAKQKAIPNSNWNDDTKAYYQSLCNKTVPDFGFFIESFNNTEEDSYQDTLDFINSELDWMESPAYLGHDNEILATYMHICWYDVDHRFPLTMAKELAGGNGNNGKKVMEFSYQYTTNNNLVNKDLTTGFRSPLVNVLRGVYDAKLHELAKDIKSYGDPVLFRLNNEMNTDWTSYCGIFNLLDPDLFVESWKYLYDIFEEEGVDNCIWIWNPFDDSYPTSYWGDFLSYYPGDAYVQSIGLTSYEFNNHVDGEVDQRRGFKDRFQNLYDLNSEFFLDLPWTVGEFACGAGGETSGELGRNEEFQAEFVKDMFEAFAKKEDYVKNIKAMIWFSKNDTDAERSVINYLKIDKGLTNTIKSFREGFEKLS